MNKELFVSSTPHETKVGLVEDDLLAEVYLELENEYTLAGSIYKGRVTRVLPGMQSAFVDIGLERDAFLYVSDFLENPEEDEEFEQLPAPAQPAQFAASNQEAESAVQDEEEELQAGEAEEQPQGGDQQGEREPRRWRGRRSRRRGRGGFPDSKFTSQSDE